MKNNVSYFVYPVTAEQLLNRRSTDSASLEVVRESVADIPSTVQPDLFAPEQGDLLADASFALGYVMR